MLGNISQIPCHWLANYGILLVDLALLAILVYVQSRMLTHHYARRTLMALGVAFVGIILMVWGGVLVLRGIKMFFCGEPAWLWKVSFKRGGWLILIGFIVFMVGGAGLYENSPPPATATQSPQHQSEYYEPSPTAAPENYRTNEMPVIPELETLMIGGIIQFGDYDWRVLDIRDDKVLLLSEYTIEYRRYHHSDEAISWEWSDMRHHLNNVFYSRFTPNERERIAEIRVVNNDNPWFGTNGGNNTLDKIFLLSIEEVVQYFGDSGMLSKGIDPAQRRALPEYGDLEWGAYFIGFHDQYGDARIAYSTDKIVSWWLLRSPGDAPTHVAGIHNNFGFFMVGGITTVSYGHGGVRPAMWVFRQ